MNDVSKTVFIFVILQWRKMQMIFGKWELIILQKVLKCCDKRKDGWSHKVFGKTGFVQNDLNATDSLSTISIVAQISILERSCLWFYYRLIMVNYDKFRWIDQVTTSRYFTFENMLFVKFFLFCKYCYLVGI